MIARRQPLDDGGQVYGLERVGPCGRSFTANVLCLPLEPRRMIARRLREARAQLRGVNATPRAAWRSHP